MSKIDYINYDDVREDRRQQKKFKKKKNLSKKLKIKGERKKYVKKMIKSYIYIYNTMCIIHVSCEIQFQFNQLCTNCYLELEAPDLPMDENGIYHLDYSMMVIYRHSLN